VVLGAILAARLARGPDQANDPDPPGPAVAVPLRATMSVVVWKKADTSRGLAVDDPKALPLEAGDYMRVEAEVSRPAYLYAVYLDAAGAASPMYPWRHYDWAARPDEARRSRLALPEDPAADGTRLGPGPSGVETALVFARDEPLSAADNEAVRRLFAGARPQGKFDPLRGTVWLRLDADGTIGGAFTNDRDRGRPEQAEAGRVEDPVQRVGRLLRTDLRGLAPTAHAVCYPFRGQ
jgi:hypothetical protein